MANNFREHSFERSGARLTARASSDRFRIREKRAFEIPIIPEKFLIYYHLKGDPQAIAMHAIV